MISWLWSTFKIVLGQRFHPPLMKKEFLSTFCCMHLQWESAWEKSNSTLKSSAFTKGLMGQRYLIVIHYIWGSEVLNDMKWIFHVNNMGCQVVVTTRMLDVANYARCSSLLTTGHAFFGRNDVGICSQQKVFKEKPCSHGSRQLANDYPLKWLWL